MIISVAVAYFNYQEYVSDYFILEFHKKENALVTTGLQIWIKQLTNDDDAMSVCLFITESYNLRSNLLLQNDPMHIMT